MLVGTGSQRALASVTSNVNRCESINGVVIYQFGTAQCESGPSATSRPNVATATGDNALAIAGVETNLGDSNDRATANGDHTSVSAYGGSNEVATGIGDGNVVQVTGGATVDLGGTGTAIGTNNVVLVYYGNDAASAVGTGDTAEVSSENNGIATAFGTNSQAYASDTDGSSALAIGGCTVNSESGLSVICEKVNGSVETQEIQSGTVKSVSSTSLTVTSSDGLSVTYTVGSSTLVDYGRSSIGYVAKGDSVQVVSVVTGTLA